MLSMRIPKGLWDDLEETVIHQDRLFLTDVARSCGLPVQEVLKRCLGTGSLQSVPTLWIPPESSEEACPWYDCHGGNLWKRCTRMRLSPSLPCYKHERTVRSAVNRTHDDPFIRSLPSFVPVRRNGILYWVDPSRKGATLHEDGSPVMDGEIRFTTYNGRRVAIWISA